MRSFSAYLPLFLSAASLTPAPPPPAAAEAYPARPPSDVGGARLTKIVIRGGALTLPVEITDSATLNRLSTIEPWSTGEPLQTTPRLTSRPQQVSFHFNRHGAILVYMFNYYPDPAGGRGYMYVPGEGDPHHRTNTASLSRLGGAIHPANAAFLSRPGMQGRWFRTSAAWDSAVGAAAQRADGATLPWIAVLAGTTALVGGMLWNRRRRERRPTAQASPAHSPKLETNVAVGSPTSPRAG